MITFETSVRVERPIEEVFAFVSNPLLFPRWNSAVQTVHGTSGESGGPGSTYSMRRQLPTGQVENELEVLSREHPTKFGIRTTSGPTPFLYQLPIRRRRRRHGRSPRRQRRAAGVSNRSRAARGARESDEVSTRTSLLSSTRSRRAHEMHDHRPHEPDRRLIAACLDPTRHSRRLSVTPRTDRLDKQPVPVDDTASEFPGKTSWRNSAGIHAFRLGTPRRAARATRALSRPTPCLRKPSITMNQRGISNASTRAPVVGRLASRSLLVCRRRAVSIGVPPFTRSGSRGYLTASSRQAAVHAAQAAAREPADRSRASPPVTYADRRSCSPLCHPILGDGWASAV